MTPEWTISIISIIIATVATLYSIYLNAVKRKKTIADEGVDKGVLASDMNYIKNRLDEIVIDNKISKKTIECHETRITVVEVEQKQLKNVPERLTKLETLSAKILKEVQ